MTRHVLQAAVTVTSALMLAACAVPSDTEPDSGEAREEMTEHVLPLPHTESLHFFSLKEIGPFDLPNGATLRVVISVKWDRPAACPRTPFFLEPARRRAIIGTYTDQLEPRPIPPDGLQHVEHWTRVDGGRYKVFIDEQHRPANCNLVGSITVSSP